jgi:hypothetical protein
MCFHHLVLGSILNDYNVSCYFNKNKTGLKIVISPKKPIPNKLPQQILDHFFNEYKKISEFSILDKIQYKENPVEKTTKNEYSCCLDIALAKQQELLISGQDSNLCLSPIVITEAEITVNIKSKTYVTNLNVINHNKYCQFYLELVEKKK